MNKLSIVIPVYYNELNLKPLYNDLKEKVLETTEFDYEIIMVNDGSQDNSWDVIQELMNIDKKIIGIRLSRNFGSHAAILCGLANSSGDCAIIKAADLQEPSELIIEMYNKWKQGNNVVLAVRKDREDKSIFSELYYWLTRKVALPNMPKRGFDVFLIDKKVIKVLNELDEKNSAITGQILWSGFRTAEVEYIREERKIGKSKWTLRKKIRLVMDTLFSFSTLPVTLISFFGILSCIIAFFWSISIIINKIRGNIDINGFTTLMVFQLFSFGIIMFTMGILGNYLWRTFDSCRNRPVYIIEEIMRNKTSPKK